MKPLLFILTLIILTGIISCQKELRNPGIVPVVKDSTAAVDTAKIKVWHGARIKGVAPNPTNGSSAPVIKAQTDTFIHGFAGRFAIIKPVVISGNVAGYYVTIKGAKDYFKVDYTKPLITEKGVGKTKANARQTGFGFRPNGVQGDSFVDSAIVLILPPNLHLPDTICVTYEAYDFYGNVSGSVTSCVIVSKLGGDSSTNWLQGGWRVFYDYDDRRGYGSPDPITAHFYDTIPYNQWVFPDYYFKNNNINGGSNYDSFYYCNTFSSGQTQFSSVFIDPFVSKLVDYSGDSDYFSKNDIIFNINAGLEQYNYYKEIRVDSFTSTCNEIKYKTNDYTFKRRGGWSIIGDKLTIILEFNQDGSPIYEIWEETIKKVSENEIWLIDYSEPGHRMYTDLKKL